MKIFSIAVAFAVLVGAGFIYQKHLVENGDLIILKSQGGSTFVEMRDKTITIKTSVFPITLWADKDGVVYSQRGMIAYRAYISANLPANREELALYHEYFL